jgi:hypothetical protein
MTGDACIDAMIACANYGQALRSASAGDIVEMDDLLASGESVEKKRAPSRKLGGNIRVYFFKLGLKLTNSASRSLANDMPLNIAPVFMLSLLSPKKEVSTEQGKLVRTANAGFELYCVRIYRSSQG